MTDLKVTPADDAIYGGHGPVLHNKYQPLEEQEDDDEIPIMVISSAGTAAPRALTWSQLAEIAEPCASGWPT